MTNQQTRELISARKTSRTDTIIAIIIIGNL